VSSELKMIPTFVTDLIIKELSSVGREDFKIQLFKLKTASKRMKYVCGARFKGLRLKVNTFHYEIANALNSDYLVTTECTVAKYLFQEPDILRFLLL
jgi:hypothetical protein